jgi:hypothetical protein
VIDRFRWALNASNPRKGLTASKRAKLWWKLALRKVRYNLDQLKRTEVRLNLKGADTSSDSDRDLPIIEIKKVKSSQKNQKLTAYDKSPLCLSQTK